ncbi:MAG: hypothetical protein V7K88_19220 [Nostoc sp.]|uniref:hypothetical protein n=1 Tax=Nostoc sp. TaxID=1180 RepID=UPI002FF86D77
MTLIPTIKREVKIMESMLFTTLTAYEEASLSGGNNPPKPAPWKKHDKKVVKYPAFIVPIYVITAPVTQIAVNINTGKVVGDLTQAAQNNNTQTVK